MQTPTGSAIRQRWPRGIFGYLAYVTDHVIFRFNSPVDWSQAMADDIWYIDPAELNPSTKTEMPTSATQVAKADGVE